MKVAILVAGGHNHREISRQLGISRAAVKAIVRDLEQVTLDLALDAA
jgi:DNA-binding CsgD family transcriptional regulator